MRTTLLMQHCRKKCAKLKLNPLHADQIKSGQIYRTSSKKSKFKFPYLDFSMKCTQMTTKQTRWFLSSREISPEGFEKTFSNFVFWFSQKTVTSTNGILTIHCIPYNNWWLFKEQFPKYGAYCT